MTSGIFAAVIAAAAAHALWNAFLKHKLDPLLGVTLISLGCGVVALPGVLVAGLPRGEATFFLAISLIVHFAYYIALAEAYRHGDLGQIYPIARGTAPLLSAVSASFVFGETMSPAGVAGVAAIAAGILLLSLRGGRKGDRFNRHAVGYGLMTALTIAAYTVVDAKGARAGESAWAYIWALFLGEGIVMLAFGLWRWGWTSLVQSVRDNAVTTFGGGALSTGAYAIAIWAMSVAPVGLVAALRETSVLFAALISVVLLREPVVPARVIAGLVILVGAVLIRVA